MDIDIEEVYQMAKKGTIPKEHLEEIFTNGFDDYNGDFNDEICFILKSFLKKDKYILEPNDISIMVTFIKSHDPSLFKQFTDKVIRNNVVIGENDFMNILDNFYYSDNIKNIQDRKSTFIDYSVNQKEFSLTELNFLKVFTQYQDVAEKILHKDNLSFSQPLYNYLNQHFLYKDTVKNKDITIVALKDNTIEHLAHELLLTANYMNEFIPQKISYDPVSLNYDPTSLNTFFTKTYKMIFDPSNNNRDKFTFDFVKKNVQIAIDSASYPSVFNAKTIEQMREKYPANHLFSRLKK